jgi:hypothetical protein
MNDFKLKLTLSILGGIAFSFIFILLAFILPTKDGATKVYNSKPANKLEEVSRSFKNK